MVTQTVLAGKDVGLVVIVRCQMMKCYKKCYVLIFCV